MIPTREYSGGRIYAGIQEGCHSQRGFCRCLEDLNGRDDEDDVGAVKTAPDAARACSIKVILFIRYISLLKVAPFEVEQEDE